MYNTTSIHNLSLGKQTLMYLKIRMYFKPQAIETPMLYHKTPKLGFEGNFSGYWLKEFHEGMGRCTGRRDITEILLKTPYN